MGSRGGQRLSQGRSGWDAGAPVPIPDFRRRAHEHLAGEIASVGLDECHTHLRTAVRRVSSAQERG